MFVKLTTTAALVLVLAIGLSAQPGPGRRGLGQVDWDGPNACLMDLNSQKGFGHHRNSIGTSLLGLVDELKLTEDQIAEIKELRLAHQMKMVDLQAEARKAGIIVRALARDKDARESEVFSAIDQAAAARADIQKDRYVHRNRCREVLTVVQLEQLDRLRLEPPGVKHGDGPRSGGFKGHRGGR